MAMLGELFDLSGRVALVTGASRGLGLQIASALGEYGASLALAPGFFLSRMTAATLAERDRELIKETPLGRLGGYADLKGPALLFASAAGAHIKDQVIVVDGGASII
jgi:NAD(P)-dependent dehydrogenase (short-subunit alcohol dehydrogenase family)